MFRYLGCGVCVCVFTHACVKVREQPRALFLLRHHLLCFWRRVLPGLQVCSAVRLAPNLGNLPFSASPALGLKPGHHALSPSDSGPRACRGSSFPTVLSPQPLEYCFGNYETIHLSTAGRRSSMEIPWEDAEPMLPFAGPFLSHLAGWCELVKPFQLMR